MTTMTLMTTIPLCTSERAMALAFSLMHGFSFFLFAVFIFYFLSYPSSLPSFKGWSTTASLIRVRWILAVLHGHFG